MLVVFQLGEEVHIILEGVIPKEIRSPNRKTRVNVSQNAESIQTGIRKRSNYSP